MLRTVILTLAMLAIAIGGGAASVWYTLQAQEGIGAVTIGNWTAYPNMGAPDADPYSKARAAREGVLALGRAEGLAFFSNRDSTGATLSRKCSYLVEGATPPARILDVLCGRPVAGRACGRPPAQARSELAGILRNAGQFLRHHGRPRGHARQLAQRFRRRSDGVRADFLRHAGLRAARALPISSCRKC